jgi:hypothetical protein
MHSFEKEILKREMLHPVASYPYKVIPLTNKAKLSFSLFNKRNGELERSNAELFKKYLNVDKFPFVGQMTFYYDDPKESEEVRKELTKDLAIRNMAERWVPGVTHVDVKKSTGFGALIKDEDYTIEVGEKITHEQPKTLTFADIKAL